MGAGGAWAYRWLTGYLPKRMVNQMKELSSIAYTWWTGGQSTCPSSSGGSPPPGEGLSSIKHCSHCIHLFLFVCLSIRW